jgi:hypothetical protein
MNKPVEQHRGMNVLDTLQPFNEQVIAAGIDYQWLGGAASKSLLDPGVTIDESAREIRLPGDFWVDQFRKPPNNSGVDFDGLSRSTCDDIVTKLAEIGDRTVGDAMKMHFFKIHDRREVSDMVAHPFGRSARYMSTADRFVTADKNGMAIGDSYMKVCFPFGVDAPIETMETWQLLVGDRPPIPTPHPAMMIVNNLTRSIAGPRAKYKDKNGLMLSHVRRSMPGVNEYLIDGPGQSHLQLASIFRTMGSHTIPAKPIIIDRYVVQPALTMRDIRNHEAFLLRNEPADLQRRVLALTKVRALIVGAVEDNIMDWWEQREHEYCYR